MKLWAVSYRDGSQEIYRAIDVHSALWQAHSSQRNALIGDITRIEIVGAT